MLVTTVTITAAAAPGPVHSGRLVQAFRRLGVVGSVLYVAAHPDDENTRLLAYLAGARGLRTGYLSMTRGDGGQNLVGTEQDELLGLLRTHELLAARSIDGAEQHFTRARDFGYSKRTDETLQAWGHDEVLSDVVLAYRRFRPDVVITRFDTTPPNHGHHMASAQLAREAFDAAADEARFGGQLALGHGVFRPDRLLRNVSTWNLPKDADLSMHVKLDVGGWEPLLGRSWGELAAEARSQHRSQGFGVAPERGPLMEYFSPVAGTRPGKDVFEGLDFTWARYPGTERVRAAVDAAVKGLDVAAPHRSIPALLAVARELDALPDENPWKARKLDEVEALIQACAGLHVEVRAAAATVVPGGTVNLDAQLLNRSPVAITLESIRVPAADLVLDGDAAPLMEHVPLRRPGTLKVPGDMRVTTPYWLRDRGPTPARYAVANPHLVGMPEGPPPFTAEVTWRVENRRVVTRVPVVHAWTDPVRGERTRVLEVAPSTTLRMDRDAVMVPNGKPVTVNVTVTAGRDAVSGRLRVELPDGWRTEPAEVPVTLARRGDESVAAFKVVPPKGAVTRGVFRAVVDVDGRAESWRERTSMHDHVPPLTIREPAEVPLVPLELAIRARRIGYVAGPGDRVAEALAAVGHDVTVLDVQSLGTARLESFDAILVGVRAYNAEPRLAVHHARLMDWVKKGGRLVVQYQTHSRLAPLTVQPGPYPMEIGRDRVTDENAVMAPLDPAEPLWTTPNRIVPADTEGWVQERGLYFAASWDERYRPVLAMNDPGEPPARGAILVGKHGKGTFIYTGLSFFRQLPAGVPGAFRLLENLLAP